MSQVSGVVLGLAYILGLLSTAVPWGGVGMLALGVGIAIAVPRYWYGGPRPRLWVIAGTVGLFAALYFQVQIPYPGVNDVSKFVTADGAAQAQVVTVEGKVETLPHLTRSQKGQFWLRAIQLNPVKTETQTAVASRRVSGKLYVTVPLDQLKELQPGQTITVTGSLYKPKPAVNPQGFDFQAYLKQRGTFAGLSGRRLTVLNRRSTWGWWIVRQRITRSQARWLGAPAGPLVSAMVLGSQSVDLPFETQDEFIRVGLAHALAASGFQTALILAVVLALTRRLDTQKQFVCGAAALITFACLSGFEPAVSRAVLMGFAGLVALVTQRKSRPVAALLGTAVILLLYNSLWVWNLGFQLSFLATLGLIVTVPALTQRLEWLPPAIASLIAVPIAAFLWTLPLQLYTFGSLPFYSILANVATTPLISLITVGGFISSLAGLIWPLAGSALAWLLLLPCHLLIGLVKFFGQLPGSSIAVGTIHLWQLLIIYALVGFVWLWPWWQSRWWLAGLVALALVVVPVWQTKATLFRAVVLATSKTPVMVIQEPGWTTLINSGDERTASLTVLPFLQQQGINQIDWAIATETRPRSDSGWPQILQRVPIKNFSDVPILESTPEYQNFLDVLKQHHATHLPLQIGQSISVASTQISFLRTEPVTLQLQIGSLSWLFLSSLNTAGQEAGVTTLKNLRQPQVVWWSGKYLTNSLMNTLQPQVLIASSSVLNTDTLTQLQASNIQLFWTNRDGAIQWTLNRGFEQTFDQINAADSKLN